jgi:hypothetical protein
MFWWKRYEPILEQKPVAGDVAIADLIAKELVEVLEAFPPAEEQVDWSDENFARRYRGRLALLPRLDARFVAQLLEIVKLDLEHESEKIDWIFRNAHQRESCPTPLHDDALKLLWPVIVEHLYQRKEDCEDILKRKHLLDICTRAEERFRQRAMRLM